MAPEARAGIPMADQLGELAALRDEGKIESIGLSNATLDEVAALETVQLGEVQNAYNIMLRDDEDVLRLCADRDIAYVPFFPSARPSRGAQDRCARTRPSPRSRPGTPLRRPRSLSRGCCTTASTSCSSRAPPR